MLSREDEKKIEKIEKKKIAIQKRRSKKEPETEWNGMDPIGQKARMREADRKARQCKSSRKEKNIHI